MATATAASKTDKKAAWKKAGTHTITLASGMEVDIRIPNLPLMVKQGSIPNNLVQTAVNVISGEQKVTAEMIAEQADFFHLLVSVMAVDPAIDVDEVHELPFEDIELLAELGTRQRDVDAVGHHIGGLHTSADWRKFRGLDYSDSSVEGV